VKRTGLFAADNLFDQNARMPRAFYADALAVFDCR